MPNDEWEELKPEMQAFAEKLLRAGWATKFRIDEGQLLFEPTAKGRKKISALGNTLSELGPIQELSSLELGLVKFLMVRELGEPPMNPPSRK
jgi:hypothetical protein